MADQFEIGNAGDYQGASYAGNGTGRGEQVNASRNDDDERKIFVGGLSWESTVKDLREYFGSFGEVLDCTLKTDPNTGKSRGFGFVLFSDSSSVDKVVASKSHMLQGRNIDPKRAKARGGREPTKKVFVGGLDPEIPEETVRAHFEAFGKIEELSLPYDKNSGQRRAFCFVTFESEDIVDRACSKSKQQIGGKDVEVKKATPKDQQGGGGFGGGRGGARGGGRGGRGGYQGGQGYDYSQGYYGGGNQGYGNYDYSGYGGGAADYNGYYGNQGGWGGYNQGSYGGGGGYGGYGQ